MTHRAHPTHVIAASAGLKHAPRTSIAPDRTCSHVLAADRNRSRCVFVVRSASAAPSFLASEPPMSLMRSVLLAGSQSRWLRERAQRQAFVRRAVSRFMPGEELDDMLRAARAL